MANATRTDDALPPGYICRHALLFEKHPDSRVQRAIEHVFREFGRVPSVMQLFRQLLGEGFQLPCVRHGKDWRDVEWITPRYQQLVDMIRNPAYAGIYVRGRYKTFSTLDENGHVQKKRRRMAREHWSVFLEGHHETYISKEVWEQNLVKLSNNTHMSQSMNSHSPQNGNGLMVGLLRCRRCGHNLHAAYNKGRVSYVCRGGDTQRDAHGKSCFCFRATRIEERLIELIFEAISPAGIAASKRAAEQLAVDRIQQRQLILDRIDASRELESRASREYKQTDETYVTVRRKLAQEWEDSLLVLQKEKEELTRFDTQCPQAATSLDLSPMSMTRLVQAGIIPAEQPQKGMPTIIRQADLSLKRVQCAVAEIKQSGNRPLSHDPNQLKLFENHDF